jgi:gamma-glutamylputrescine oxidase
MKSFTNPRDRLPSDDICLYKDQNDLVVRYPRLSGDVKTDVCVIGGGFTGLVTALNLARRGVNVTLIERHRMGWGASGRNSGQIIPGFNMNARDLERIYGDETAIESYKATLRAMQFIKDTVASRKIDCSLRPGLIMAAPSDAACRDLQDYQAYLKNVSDCQTDYLDSGRAAKALGTTAYKGGLHNSHAARFNPYQYILGLSAYAAEEGAHLHEETPAVRIECGEKVTVHTPNGTITANKVLLAGGAYLGNLVPALRRKYLLLRTSMIATDPLDQDIYDRIIPADTAVFEWRHLLSYYQKINDNRLIFGGGDSPLFSSKKGETRTFSKIVKRMETIFPELEGCHISHWWGGYMDVTRHQIPEIGHKDEKLYYAFGYSGHGVVPSHMVGDILAAMMSGGREVPNFVKHFHAPDIPFAGQNDALLARLGILWYRLRDVVDAF